ncbi:DUF6314 family protein [Sinomonas sp.]|uniref:DUF6314 family protein n=1 Tax=Sinomonas sp. TaxID=1914986 RepID=UPI003F7F5874
MESSTRDLRAYLRGTWTVQRSLLDRATGARGSFSGLLTFTDTDDDGALLQRESGTIRWGQHEGPATREYVWRPTSESDTMDVFFPDGRFFHRVSLSAEPASPGSAGAEAEHWCAPDTYRVSYEVVGPDELRYEWDVMGPAKDLLLTTVLARMP